MLPLPPPCPLTTISDQSCKVHESTPLDHIKEGGNNLKNTGRVQTRHVSPLLHLTQLKLKNQLHRDLCVTGNNALSQHFRSTLTKLYLRLGEENILLKKKKM